MYYESIEISMDEAMRKRLRITGVVLLLIGALGILLPQVVSVTLSLLIAALLILAGLASLALAVIFIAGWPFNSLWLVGLLVGISLLFDGIALLMLTGRDRTE